MHALPAGLWDTTVKFSAEITDRDDGVEWVVRAPLGLVQTSLWTVERDAEADEERWTLIEDVTIRCSRLLVGTVRGKCEANWKGTHERWVAQLEKEREKDATG
jgi:hypothetical protein